MNFPSRLLTRSFMVGVLIVSTAYGASALTVKRTNQLVDGIFVPVLVVKHRGQTFIHMMGEDGLTRAIIFNHKRALDWARAKYGAETASLEGGGDGGSNSADFGDDGDADGGFTG